MVPFKTVSWLDPSCFELKDRPELDTPSLHAFFDGHLRTVLVAFEAVWNILRMEPRPPNLYAPGDMAVY